MQIGKKLGAVALLEFGRLRHSMKLEVLNAAEGKFGCRCVRVVYVHTVYSRSHYHCPQGWVIQDL